MMDDRMLINLVKQRPILYNPSHVNYLDAGMKITVWDEIGVLLNYDADRCKARWNNIRDNYKKNLNKLKHNKNTKPYRFTYLLGFLKRYLDERELKAKPNFKIAQDKVPEGDEIVSEPQFEDVEEEMGQEDNSNSLTPDCEVVISVPEAPPVNFRKRKLIRETPSTILMKYLTDKKSAQGATSQEQPAVNSKHPVDAFLFALSPILKSLPQHLLTLAKSEIFTCVQKYEMNTTKINGSTGMNIVTEASHGDEGNDKLQRLHEKRDTTKECLEPPLKKSLIAPTPVEDRRNLSDTMPSQNELLKSAWELLSSCKETDEKEDEYQHIAKLWTCKLKSLAPMQKRLAERAINEILFEADLGTLRRNSVQINYFHDTSARAHSFSLPAVGSTSVACSQPQVTQSTSASHSYVSFNDATLFDKDETGEPPL